MADCVCCRKRIGFFDTGIPLMEDTKKQICNKCEGRYGDDFRTLMYSTEPPEKQLEMKEQVIEKIRAAGYPPEVEELCIRDLELRFGRKYEKLREQTELVDQRQPQEERMQDLNSEIRIRFREGIILEGLIAVDQQQRIWAVPDREGFFRKVHAFDELLGFEVVQNGRNIQSSNSGKALIGWALFGVVGAIVGSAGERTASEEVTDLHIRVTLNSVQESALIIPFVQRPMKADSNEYRAIALAAERTASLLELIRKSNETTKPVESERIKATLAVSVADEILKFKQLWDAGIITEEEFQAQKKKLLALEY